MKTLLEKEGVVVDCGQKYACGCVMWGWCVRMRVWRLIVLFVVVWWW
jgi:hypothetical protein